jgi:hypothetical protein
VFFAFNFSLNPCVVNFAYFLRVESRPFLVVERLVEALDVLHIDEVDEGVSHVALVEEVNRQVEKVKFVLEFFVDGREHLLLGVFVRNVSYHKSGPIFGDYFVRDDLESLVVFHFLTVREVEYLQILIGLAALRVLSSFSFIENFCLFLL